MEINNVPCKNTLLYIGYLNDLHYLFMPRIIPYKYNVDMKDVYRFQCFLFYFFLTKVGSPYPHACRKWRRTKIEFVDSALTIASI